MVKVKICGMQSLQDIKVCRGADALGFIVSTPKSQRNIDLELAERLMAAVAPSQLKVAVTTATGPEKLAQIASALRPDVLQVHAELSTAAWEEIRAALPEGVKLYGLVGVSSSVDEGSLIRQARELACAPLDALVLDTKLSSRTGGTGRSHDWGKSRTLRVAIHPLPAVLAGGLTPQNVLEAIRIVKPAWVDLASGVEEGGRKSARKVEELLRKVKDD
jgi:phosphoribosylanthranilate isomerase